MAVRRDRPTQINIGGYFRECPANVARILQILLEYATYRPVSLKIMPPLEFDPFAFIVRRRRNPPSHRACQASVVSTG